MGDVEHQSSLKVGFRTLQSLSFGVVVLTEVVVAAGFVDVVLLIVCLFDEIIVDLYGFSNLKR